MFTEHLCTSMDTLKLTRSQKGKKEEEKKKKGERAGKRKEGGSTEEYPCQWGEVQ